MVCIKAWSNAEPWRGPRYIDLALDCFDLHKTFGMWIKSEGELYFFLNHFTLYQGSEIEPETVYVQAVGAHFVG